LRFVLVWFVSVRLGFAWVLLLFSFSFWFWVLVYIRGYVSCMADEWPNGMEANKQSTVHDSWGEKCDGLGAHKVLNLAPPSLPGLQKYKRQKICRENKTKMGKTEEKTKLLAPTVLGRWAFCSGFCCGRGICTCSPCLLHLECKRAATIFGPPSRPLLSFSSAIDAWMTICKQIGQIMGIEMGTTIHYIANTA